MPEKWKHLVVLISKDDRVIKVDNIEIEDKPWPEYLKALGDLGWELISVVPFGTEGRSRAYLKASPY